MERAFHIGDVLSITTGKLVSLRHIEGIYDILGFMTGENLMTHQLPRACREVATEILRQHPDLAAVSAPTLTPETWRLWLDEQVENLGESRSLTPMLQHEAIDPMLELMSMTDKPIIAVKL